MNTEQAKHALLAYRPGTEDEDEPEIAEALALARLDPALQVWLEQHQAAQDAIRSQFRALPTPPDLRARILANRPPVQRKIVPLWRRVEFLAAAACLLLAVGLSILLAGRSGEDQTYVGFRARVVGFALREYRMDILTNDPVQIRQFLRAQHAPADYALTPELQATPVMGGASLSWQGHAVSMVCFSLPQKQILYMFVMDKSALHGKTPGETPLVEPTKGVMTASWTDQGKIYVMAARTSAPLLQQKLRKAG